MPETTAQKITRLQELLETGVRSTSVDGVTTSFDLESVRRELRRLKILEETTRRRSVFNTPNMGRR